VTSTAAGRRLRACFVTPWYGRDIPGGAEAEARRTAQNLAAAGVQVTVLTTRLSGPGGDWDRGRLPKGETHEEGVRVLRFPTVRRIGRRFELLKARVVAGAPLTDEEEREYFTTWCTVRPARHWPPTRGGPFFFIRTCSTSVLGR
jgi:hypothetical protein